MKLQTLSLANFRGFEQLEMSFEPDMTLIAGVNGVGKSSILQVLATLFTRALPEFTPCTVKPSAFIDEDIQHNKKSLEVSVSFSVNKQRFYGGVQRIHKDVDFGDIWNRFWLSENEANAQPRTFSQMLAGRTLTGDLEAGRADTERMFRGLKKRKQQPVVIYFTPQRQLPGRPRKLPPLKAFEIANAYNSALVSRQVDLREFMHWFRVVETEASEAHRIKGADVLDNLREVATTFIPEFKDLRIEESPELRFVVQKNSTDLAINQLSDGERGLLSMLFDITRRLSIANPDLRDPVAEGAGIILIDEVELHLHPKWQRQVLRRLRKTFKNCQFIVTSHSPQVIGQIRPRCLRLLDWNDDSNRIVLHHVSQSFGMDSNWVLQNIMGSPARDYETERMIGTIYDQIDEEKLDRAAELIADIENAVGLFPELQEAKLLLARLEMLRADEKD
ncbi:MAG: AAA family ATPase [Proteobacteria bacterium]|nr:AAA family ATPase [Pseudomonadota bacterium]